MSEIDDLKKRIDELQVRGTALENERREWKMRADSWKRFMMLAVSVGDREHVETLAQVRVEAMRTDAILQDAWTQTTMAVKAFLAEAHAEVHDANATREQAVQLAREFILRWVERFKLALGENSQWQRAPTFTTRWGHSREEQPERWSGAFETRDEAIAEGRAQYGASESFWICAGETPDKLTYLPDADSILNDMACAADGDAGEASESWPDVSKEGEAALNRVLQAWGERYLNDCEFWIGDGSPERIEPLPVEPIPV